MGRMVVVRSSTFVSGGTWLLIMIVIAAEIFFSVGANEPICGLNSTQWETRDSTVRTMANQLILNMTSNITGYLLNNTYRKTMAGFQSSAPLIFAFNMTGSLWQNVNSGSYSNIPDTVLGLGLPAWYSSSDIMNYTFTGGTVLAQKWNGTVWSVPLTWVDANLTLPEFIQHAYIHRLYEQLELLTQRTFFPLGGFSFPRSLAYSGIVKKDNNWDFVTCQVHEGFSFKVLFSFTLKNVTRNITKPVLSADIENSVDAYARKQFGASYLQSNVSSLEMTTNSGAVNASIKVKLFFNGSYQETAWVLDNRNFSNSIMSQMAVFSLLYYRTSAICLVPPQITECYTYLLAQNTTDTREILSSYKIMACPNRTSTSAPTPMTSPSTQYQSTENMTASIFPATTDTATTTLLISNDTTATVSTTILPTVANKSTTMIGNGQGAVGPQVIVYSNVSSSISSTLENSTVVPNASLSLNVSSASNSTGNSTSSNVVSQLESVTEPSTAKPPKPTPIPTTPATNTPRTVKNNATTVSYTTTSKLMNNLGNATLGQTSTVSNVSLTLKATASSTTLAPSTAPNTVSNVTMAQRSTIANTTLAQTNTVLNTVSNVTLAQTSTPSTIPTGNRENLQTYSSLTNASYPPTTLMLEITSEASTSTASSKSVTTLLTTVALNTTVASTPVPTTATTANQTTTGKTTLKNYTMSTQTTHPRVPMTSSSPTTPFDEDPFFKAVVPVVTKKYNDKVLLAARFGTMTPITQKTYFYTIAIPSAMGILLCAFACLMCWQVDWTSASHKKHELQFAEIIKG